MRQFLAALLALVVAGAAAADWACWRGPNGCGEAIPCKKPLVDDLSAMRLVWKSEWMPGCENRIGRMGRSSGFSSPAVAEGRVYVFYYLGDGKVFDEQQLALAKERGVEEKLARQWASVAADETLHCMDAATGKTLWKRVYPAAGINYQGSGKAGGHYTPCVAGGRVYVLGTTGILYCVDAATGRPLWQVPGTDGQCEKLQKTLHDLLAAKKRHPFSRSRGWFPCSTPAVNAGVVAVGDGRGLIGFDAATGKRLWRVDGCLGWESMPLAWSAGGRDCFVATATCVEARTGKVLWRIDGARHSCGTVAVAGNRLVLGGNGRADKGITGYEITPEGAKELWTLGSEYVHSGNCNSMAIISGYAIVNCPHLGGQNRGKALCVDVNTGKVVGETGHWGGKLCTSIIGTNGHVLVGGSRLRWLRVGEGFAQLGEMPEVSYSHSTTPAIVDGRLYLRGTDALYCYDLRAAVEP